MNSGGEGSVQLKGGSSSTITADHKTCNTYRQGLGLIEVVDDESDELIADQCRPAVGILRQAQKATKDAVGVCLSSPQMKVNKEGKGVERIAKAGTQTNPPPKKKVVAEHFTRSCRQTRAGCLASPPNVAPYRMGHPVVEGFAERFHAIRFGGNPLLDLGVLCARVCVG